MNDSGFVRRGERVGNLDCDVQAFGKVETGTAQAMAQRFAFVKLGGNDVRPGRLPNLVDRDDVWMVQRRSRPGFLFESAQSIVVFGE